MINSYLLCRPLSFDCRQEIDKQKSEGPNGIKESNFLQAVFSPLSSLRGWRLKGRGKGVLGKGVLGAREKRGAREEGGRETKTPFPKAPFPFPFKRLPRRLAIIYLKAPVVFCPIFAKLQEQRLFFCRLYRKW